MPRYGLLTENTNKHVIAGAARIVGGGGNVAEIIDIINMPSDEHVLAWRCLRVMFVGGTGRRAWCRSRTVFSGK